VLLLYSLVLNRVLDWYNRIVLLQVSGPVGTRTDNNRNNKCMVSCKYCGGVFFETRGLREVGILFENAISPPRRFSLCTRFNRKAWGGVCFRKRDGRRDGIQDSVDNCPKTANSNQLDTDGDGKGDECDPDIDGDGIGNAQDNCMLVYNPDQADFDGQ